MAAASLDIIINLDIDKIFTAVELTLDSIINLNAKIKSSDLMDMEQLLDTNNQLILNHQLLILLTDEFVNPSNHPSSIQVPDQGECQLVSIIVQRTYHFPDYLPDSVRVLKLFRRIHALAVGAVATYSVVSAYFQNEINRL